MYMHDASTGNMSSLSIILRVSFAYITCTVYKDAKHVHVCSNLNMHTVHVHVCQIYIVHVRKFHTIIVWDY